ncbi:MAG: hypothetical protein AB8G05_03165 [Oligoflexales bacterium]
MDNKNDHFPKSKPIQKISNPMYINRIERQLNSENITAQKQTTEPNLQSYEQLLSFKPNQKNFGRKPDNFDKKSIAQVLGGEKFQELKMDSEALRYLFTVPYYVRAYFSKEVSSRAVIFLSRNKLQIKSLSGQPILRACLFESFLAPEGKIYLLSIMKHLDVRTITITLKLIPKVSVADSGLTHKYKTFLDPNGVSYEIYYDRTAKQGGNLPDTYVQKDINWDREKLRELKNSVAYKRVVRDYTL